MFSCSRTGVLYIAEPPQGVPLGSLLAQAASQALDSPLPLALDPLFSAEAAQLAAVLFPSSGDLLLAQHPTCPISSSMFSLRHAP